MKARRSRQTQHDVLRGVSEQSEKPGGKAKLDCKSDKRKIEWVPIASLTPYPNNPRTHSPAQIRQIAQSIRRFGWTVPLLIDQNDRVIAGHARLEACPYQKFH
jgi:ParB-like nuclease domain